MNLALHTMNMFMILTVLFFLHPGLEQMPEPKITEDRMAN